MNIELPVSAVTVMEDRAQVCRRGRVSLPAGRSVLTVPAVAPVLSDRSVRCEVDGRPIVDSHVTRRPRILREHKPESLQTVQALVRDLERRQADGGDALQRLDEEQRLLRKAMSQFVVDASLDTGWGQPDPEGWGLALAALGEEDRKNRQRSSEVALSLDEIGDALDDARALERTLLTPSSGVLADVVMTVILEAAGEVELSVEYVVPGACWRPRHTAEYRDGRLRWATEGCVWQNTGEDWTDAAIELSTQRASLGAEPPVLVEDRLQVQDKQDVVVAARDEAIETAGDGVDVKVAKGLPGIDDGGEVRALAVQGAATVRSDGRPTFLPLFRFEADAALELVAMPELERAAVHRCRVANAAPVPILAGPVELMRDGGRVGRSTVLFVGSGEQFSLGFGRDPAVRIHRRAERTEHAPGAMSRWHRIEQEVVLKLSNLASEARRVELVERVPVSEVPEVEISVDAKGTTEGRSADAHGMVRWAVTLQGGERREIRLAYTVRHRAGVTGM